MPSIEPCIPIVPPEDAMTPAEKSKAERDARLNKQKDIKQKTVELDAKKKQADLYKKSVDQAKRFEIPSLNKDLQTLKGAKI